MILSEAFRSRPEIHGGEGGVAVDITTGQEDIAEQHVTERSFR